DLTLEDVEAGLGEELLERGRSVAAVDVTVRGGDVGVIVRGERDHGQIAAAAEDARRLGDDARAIVDVAEDVEEEDLIERPALERERRGVAYDAGDVLGAGEAVFGGGDHLLASIDA